MELELEELELDDFSTLSHTNHHASSQIVADHPSAHQLDDQPTHQTLKRSFSCPVFGDGQPNLYDGSLDLDDGLSGITSFLDERTAEPPSALDLQVDHHLLSL